MNSWFWIWVIRILLGEKVRKANRSDYQLYSGFLVLAPIVAVSFFLVIHNTSSTNGWLLGALFTGFGSIGYFGCMLWSSYVPMRFSYPVAAVVWAITVWLIFHYLVR